jgi:predicted methyltransferase
VRSVATKRNGIYSGLSGARLESVNWKIGTGLPSRTRLAFDNQPLVYSRVLKVPMRNPPKRVTGAPNCWWPGRRELASLVLVLASVLVGPACSAAQDSGDARDKWQRPQEVMDALAIRAGSAVADVGCGSGYFTFKLAQRVGPQGEVYAEDIDGEAVAGIRRRAEAEALTQVRPIVGVADDPRLPAASLDAILVVNSYHEWREYSKMLQHLSAALKPGGLLAIIDGVAEPGKSRAEYYSRHRMPEGSVREDAAREGFRFVRKEPGFLRPDQKKDFYFLIFEKP